jgi:predicted neuraminidase
MVRKGQLQNPAEPSKRIGYPVFSAWVKQAGILVEPAVDHPCTRTVSFSLMAFPTTMGTWRFSEPLNKVRIQPSIATRADGTLVAYMRDNGSAPKRLHISTSKDKGLTWSPVRDSELPNPGSGADIVTLGNGHWVLAYNDTERGRESLAVSLSLDEGKTWPHTRHLESGSSEKSSPSAAYPSIIQGADDSLHVVYSFHGTRKTIKHAHFTEEWLQR